MTEEKLIQKLRLIEALHSGATTSGEREAADRARERILERLASMTSKEKDLEHRFTLQDRWNRKVFLALARRYKLRPYRRKGQRYTTVMISAPRSFVDEILWPEFLEISDTLQSYFDEITNRVVAEVIHKDTSDATVTEEELGKTSRKPDSNTSARETQYTDVAAPPSAENSFTEQKKATPASSLKVQRNTPCPCGSGKKYKKCCGRKVKQKQ